MESDPRVRKPIAPRDPDQRVGESEFSWGEGLAPRGREDYCGKTPPINFTSPPTDDTGRIITGKDY